MMNTVFLGFVQNHVSQASRCLCKGGLDDMPCWRCSRTAFEVYWVARFAEPPIRATNHKYTRTGTSLRLTLLKFRKAVKLRRFY